MFDGRVAIIIGSGQGIGKEFAKYMAGEGCKVVTNNRKPVQHAVTKSEYNG